MEHGTYSGGLNVVKFAALLEMGVEFTFGRVLKDHVDSRVVVEVTIETENVGMA